jgi:1,2-diacylglycerol-3-alpha-glucose alpha-1,2-galactosyltransferase
MAGRSTLGKIAVAGAAVAALGVAYGVLRARKAAAQVAARAKDPARKPEVCLLSFADTVPGQGVGSAYVEHLKLLRTLGAQDFSVRVNKGSATADVVHLVSIDPVCYLRMRLTKRPTIASVHFTPDTFDNGTVRLPGPVNKLFMRYVARLYRTADYLHTVNPTTVETLCDLGIDRERVFCIPNVVSPEGFHPLPAGERAALRERWGIPQDAFAVVASGQVQIRKGVLTFAEVARQMPDVQFVWAGGFSFGPLTERYQELKQLVEHPPANLRFLGIIPREEMNGLLNACDLFFLPTYGEQFGMSIMEGAFAGLPVLFNHTDDGLYELVYHDTVLRGSSVAEFVSLIERLRNDKEFYATWAERASRLVERYSSERLYARWKELYGHALRREALPEGSESQA